MTNPTVDSSPEKRGSSAKEDPIFWRECRRAESISFGKAVSSESVR